MTAVLPTAVTTDDPRAPLSDEDLVEVLCEAEENIESGFAQFGAATVLSLATEVAESREPFAFDRFVVLAERFLTNYPADIFTGVSGDPGPRFVVALRTAVETLNRARSK